MKTCLTLTCILLTSILQPINAAELSVSRKAYGKTSTGEKVTQYTLANKNNITVKLITLGATLTSLTTPDRDGNLADIVLGYDDLVGYENDGIYSGCIVGRFANRISGASFKIGDQQYELADNFANGHHLHGGEVGFNSRIWKATVLKLDNAVGVSFQLVSEDGDEGYPGKLTVRVNYTLSATNDLAISYFATTTKTTHINLTQHSYFNLAGHDSGDVHSHFVRLYCDHYLR
jgi:aldose 1-epimerase